MPFPRTRSSIAIRRSRSRRKSSCRKNHRSPRRLQLESSSESKWRYDGVRVVRSDELDVNTAQTPGINRAAAITHARAGAEKLGAGTVRIPPKPKTGLQHPGPSECEAHATSGV